MAIYANGKIYKVYSPSLDKCYIGSTISTLSRRFTHHCSYTKTNPGECSIDPLILAGDAVILLVENFPCDTNTELLQREGYWIRHTENALNTYLPGKTEEEKSIIHKMKCKNQYLKNRQKRLDYQKQRYKEKKETILAKSREKIECECGSKINRSSVSKHRRSIKHQTYIKSLPVDTDGVLA